MILTGQSSYTFPIKSGGTATYRRGATIPPAHFDQVPEKDRHLFSDKTAKAAKSAPATDAPATKKGK